MKSFSFNKDASFKENNEEIEVTYQVISVFLLSMISAFDTFPINE
jgi:hypothetical protein